MADKSRGRLEKGSTSMNANIVYKEDLVVEEWSVYWLFWVKTPTRAFFFFRFEAKKKSATGPSLRLTPLLRASRVAPPSREIMEVYPSVSLPDFAHMRGVRLAPWSDAFLF